MSTMPRQKPGHSVQRVQTPPEFLDAVRSFLCTRAFALDLAADGDNHVAPRYYTENDDALCRDWASDIGTGLWAWCNPPYADIAPWVTKAARCKPRLSNYAGIALLCPASVGANWWKAYVHPTARVLFLNGRLTFVGHTKPYPKDCALLLYSPSHQPGYNVWTWKEEGRG